MGLNKLDESLTSNNGLPVMEFIYTNWKGQTTNRRIQNPTLWYGESKYHKGAQWFFHAFDLEKDDFRDFAVADILTFVDNKGV